MKETQGKREIIHDTSLKDEITNKQLITEAKTIPGTKSFE